MSIWIPPTHEPCDALGRLGRVVLRCQASRGHRSSHIAEHQGEPVFWGLGR